MAQGNVAERLAALEATVSAGFERLEEQVRALPCKERGAQLDALRLNGARRRGRVEALAGIASTVLKAGLGIGGAGAGVAALLKVLPPLL